jgi:polyisoprenoid-binding protein YceI
MRRNALIGLAAGLVAVSTAVAAPPFATRSDNGKTLRVPTAESSAGKVYYALSGKDRQIYFESDAPLEDIKGQSNQVVGYAVAGRGSDEASLVSGEWHLPVDSMRTGIKLRDEHLAGGDWLDAKSFPNIVFQIHEVRDVRSVKKTAAFRSYSATLVGEMTIHGVTNPIEISGATLTFLDASKATASVAPGDLLSIRASLSATLSEFGISHPVIGNKVADEIAIDVSLFLSTVSP